MNRRNAVLAVAALAAAPAVAAPKYPFEIYVRPIDNGYLLKLYSRGGDSVTSPIGEPEVMAPDTAMAAAVLKVWLDALK